MIREGFLDDPTDHGLVVVHGHTPVAEPAIRTNRIGIDTRAWESGRLTCLVIDGAERHFLSTG
jgi:serine/threonine protein phosphatase 1